MNNAFLKVSNILKKIIDYKFWLLDLENIG